MKKTRVKKGEKYYLINTTLGTLEVDYLRDWRTGEDDAFFKTGNYFTDEKEAERVANLFRAVLKGADVIEMPSEEELRKNLPYQQFTRWSDGELGERNGWRDCYIWLKSKIVK